MKFKFLNMALLTILIVSIFLTSATSSMSTYEPLQSDPEYDPRIDLNDNGKIDLYDVVMLLTRYHAEGMPNKNSVLVNGDFETGTWAGWWLEPEDARTASISNTIVHDGLYSAYISNEPFYYQGIRQDVYMHVRRSINSNISLEGWIYPLNVGLLNAQWPFSAIRLRFYNESSMLHSFNLYYTWCLALGWGNGSTRLAIYLSNWQVSEWNFFSRNVTADIYSHFGSLDFSDIMLYSVEAVYHHSTVSPGAFYLDDLKISTD